MQKYRKETERKTCGQCRCCTPVRAHHTLTVKDRKPTMGRCPYNGKYCVLLSQTACKEHFVPRDKPESEQAESYSKERKAV